MVHWAGTPPSKKDGSVVQQTRLHKRGNVYYFRAGIPLNIQNLYAPPTEIKFSLRVSFPRFFVCQRADFMLPVFPDVAR